MGCDAAAGRTAGRCPLLQDQVSTSSRPAWVRQTRDHLCAVLDGTVRYFQRWLLAIAIYTATQGADPLLLDYNQPPTAISLDSSSVAENAPTGTTVGTLNVTDPDGDAPTYTLSSACYERRTVRQRPTSPSRADAVKTAAVCNSRLRRARRSASKPTTGRVAPSPLPWP